MVFEAISTPEVRMSTKFEKPRKAGAQFKFNGKNVTEQLKGYLRTVTYTDIASGSSDQLDLELQDIDARWLGKWYPTKGDKVEGYIVFRNWAEPNTKTSLAWGTYVLDEISFSGGPMTAKFGCVAAPNNESFRVRQRTKTWEKITVQGIAKEIAGRYKLGLKYSAETIMISSLEQSDQADCEFLYKVCETYGLSMKVYAGDIVIYSQTEAENKKPIARINRRSFVDDKWDYVDTLAGVYTGARISYKSGKKDDDEISVYLGLIGENAPGSRVLRISETADDRNDAYYKAAAQVNKSNQAATTLSGQIFPNRSICAGVCVQVQGMGKANGKYYVDSSKIEIGESGTTQTVEMHKCQKRLKAK